MAFAAPIVQSQQTEPATEQLEKAETVGRNYDP